MSSPSSTACLSVSEKSCHLDCSLNISSRRSLSDIPIHQVLTFETTAFFWSSVRESHFDFVFFMAFSFSAGFKPCHQSLMSSTKRDLSSGFILDHLSFKLPTVLFFRPSSMYSHIMAIESYFIMDCDASLKLRIFSGPADKNGMITKLIRNVSTILVI